MSNRRYRLLCPISRTLDYVGDRWTLLILRDLHAGPVRHKDLAAGLTGMPPNLLATRLKELVADGLVEKKSSEHGVPLYGLTDLGEATGPVLFELSKLGARFPADQDPRPPGNLRLAAVYLKEALSRVEDDAELGPTEQRAANAGDLHVELRIDGEPFDIQAHQGRVSLRYRSADQPQAVISVPYEPMIAYGDGRIAPDAFAQQVTVEGDGEVAGRFFERLERAMRS